MYNDDDNENQDDNYENKIDNLDADDSVKIQNAFVADDDNTDDGKDDDSRLVDDVDNRQADNDISVQVVNVLGCLHVADILKTTNQEIK